MIKHIGGTMSDSTEKTPKVEEVIKDLESKKLELIKIYNDLVRGTAIDADSAIVNAASARISLIERKLGLIEREIEVLKTIPPKGSENKDETE